MLVTHPESEGEPLQAVTYLYMLVTHPKSEGEQPQMPLRIVTYCRMT